MPKANDLPIYLQCRDLLSLALHMHKQMSKDIKPNLGRQLLQDCSELAQLVARANVCTAPERVQILATLIQRAEALKISLRLMMDVRVIAISIWSRSIPLLESICKQAGGWRKASGTSKFANPSNHPVVSVA